MGRAFGVIEEKLPETGCLTIIDQNPLPVFAALPISRPAPSSEILTTVNCQNSSPAEVKALRMLSQVGSCTIAYVCTRIVLMQEQAWIRNYDDLSMYCDPHPDHVWFARRA